MLQKIERGLAGYFVYKHFNDKRTEKEHKAVLERSGEDLKIEEASIDGFEEEIKKEMKVRVKKMGKEQKSLFQKLWTKKPPKIRSLIYVVIILCYVCFMFVCLGSTI